MNYLASYYKNLCEQVENEILLVKKQIQEQSLATPANNPRKLSQQPVSNRMRAQGTGTINNPPADTPAPPEVTAQEQDEAEEQTREDVEDTREEPQGAVQGDAEEPTREDVEDTKEPLPGKDLSGIGLSQEQIDTANDTSRGGQSGKFGESPKPAEQPKKEPPKETPKEKEPEVGLKPASMQRARGQGGAGFGGGSSQSTGQRGSSFSGQAPPKNKPKQEKGESWEEYQSRVQDWKDSLAEYKEYLSKLREENKQRQANRERRS